MASPSPSPYAVSCIVAVDGGSRMANEWSSMAGGYVPAILRQVGNLHPNASISVASVVIYSLPPTSRQPLVVTPFQPVPTFITATLPDLLGVQGSKQAAAIVGGKGKNRETTSELDYALLEGLTVATCMLETRKQLHAQQQRQSPTGGKPTPFTSYLFVLSAQDVPTTNFWDDEPNNSSSSLPSSHLWPGLAANGPLSDATSPSTSADGLWTNAWQTLVEQLTGLGTHLCTITTRVAPRLEEFQRRVAAAKGVYSQSLPNLQSPEHAILLSGFQPDPPPGSSLSNGASTVNSHKRSHSVASPANPQEALTPSQAGSANQHLNKKVKFSPLNDHQPPSLPTGSPSTAASSALQAESSRTITAFSTNALHLLPGQAQAVQFSPPATTMQPFGQQMQQTQMQVQPQPAYGDINPAGLPMNGFSNGQQSAAQQNNSMQQQAVNGSGQSQQVQQQQNTPLTFLQELNRQREEIKKQMKQFMNHLRQKAINGEISQDKARATAEKVRQEAAKKLAKYDALEAQFNASPGSAMGALPAVTEGQGGVQLPTIPEGSPNSVAQQLQTMAQQQPSGGFGDSSSAMSGNTGNANNTNTGSNQQQQQGGAAMAFVPSHNRQGSTASSSNVFTPQNNPSGALQLSPNNSGNASQLLGSPQKQLMIANLTVWSGAIKWSLMDPVTKSKKDLAFFVDAIPMRPNAAVELANVQWPPTMEVAHISPMAMSDLQKYSQDNRIQVVSFVKAAPTVVESLGISQGQNDGLYQLLAKNLESKASVAIVKLPGPQPNRGIVVVALPGQNKLVGLVFLNSPLPPRTPGTGSQAQLPAQGAGNNGSTNAGGNNNSNQTLQQQQQQAFQQMMSAQQQHLQNPFALQAQQSPPLYSFNPSALSPRNPTASLPNQGGNNNSNNTSGLGQAQDQQQQQTNFFTAGSAMGNQLSQPLLLSNISNNNNNNINQNFPFSFNPTQQQAQQPTASSSSASPSFSSPSFNIANLAQIGSSSNNGGSTSNITNFTSAFANLNNGINLNNTNGIAAGNGDLGSSSSGGPTMSAPPLTDAQIQEMLRELQRQS